MGEPVSNGRRDRRPSDLAGCAGAPELNLQARGFYLVAEGEVTVTVVRKSARYRQKYNNPGKSVRHWQARCRQGRAWGSA